MVRLDANFSQKPYGSVKCKYPCPEFKLGLPYLFPTMMQIIQRDPL